MVLCASRTVDDLSAMEMRDSGVFRVCLAEAVLNKKYRIFSSQ